MMAVSTGQQKFRPLAGAMIALCLAFPAHAAAEQAVQAKGKDAHPILIHGVQDGPAAFRARLERDADSAKRHAAMKARMQPYVDRHRDDPKWITSRLQMYWQAKHTQVFVRNGYYDHAEGTAPVPTVRFTGARDTNTAYATPKLEDVKPYMGENDRLYLQNKTAPGQPWEWVEQAKTGRIIESINMRIIELARDAAFLYWASGDEAYATFAYDVFDTYMSGLYYRETPVDLNRGHDQTLVGLQSYEVIHEDIAGPLAESYDLMHSYIVRRAGDKRAVFDGAFKKWADLIMANGVPWNNWNLIKARFVLQIAAVLGDDAQYADKQGRQHYVQAVVEGKGPRQWSLKRLLESGYDQQSAMWNESAGYSLNVLQDYLECLEMLERIYGVDLLPQMPILPRAARALPQYLLPNGRIVGFGDSRYDYMRTSPVAHLLAYAQRHGLAADAKGYAALMDAIRSTSGAHTAAAAPSSPAPIAAYQTPTFFVPNASWLIQRNGYEGPDARDHALVISQAGSSGNHAHANGIAMELFAQGLSIAPESGRGSGYFQNDHREYYSQFAAHNTVVVDGKSTYASMKSNHPLTVRAVYPQSGAPAAGAFPLATFSVVDFREPETNATQQRVLGTVRLDGKTGYFVDIFRSRRQDGADRYHDYIYHNLGQSMRFTGPAGQALATAPSSKLAFADGDIIGYDYWWDRKALSAAHPLQARFKLALPDRSVAMTAWLQGGAKREFFSVQAPPSTAWTAGTLPAGIDKLPLQTLVVRQTGEAWSKPFTAVFEAVKNDEAAGVLAVDELKGTDHSTGMLVRSADGSQAIMSGDSDSAAFVDGDRRLVGRYGIAAVRGGALHYLFLGHGSEVAGHGYAINSEKGTSAALWQEQGQWRYTASRPVRLRVPAAEWPGELAFVANGRTLKVRGRTARFEGRDVKVFELPASAATRIR